MYKKYQIREDIVNGEMKYFPQYFNEGEYHCFKYANNE